jgi:hypothetical protein
MIIELTDLYLCERCFSAAEAPGVCPRGHGPLRHCVVGAFDDPRRRPPTDTHGRLLSRAPRWWVQFGAPDQPRPADGAPTL